VSSPPSYHLPLFLPLTLTPNPNPNPNPARDQMRQRLVRMSVRHHKQEKELKSKLEECAGALLECITLLNVIAPEAVPTHIQQTASRVAAIVEKEQKPRALKIGRI